MKFTSSLARRALLAAAVGSALPPHPAVSTTPEVTSRVSLGVRIGGTPRQFVTLGLYGVEAPASVQAFKDLCAGSLAAAPGITYAGSSVMQIIPDEFILAGTPAAGESRAVDRSLDRTGYIRSTFLNRAEILVNTDSNALSHDRAGLVSMKRGGGAFEFVLTPAANPMLDRDYIVIGEVLEGQQVITSLNMLPVRMPSQQSELSGLASYAALKAAVGLGVAGAIARVYAASGLGFNLVRFGFGGLAATLIGGDDPQKRSRELAYRPLKKVRIESSRVL